jgi:hypothetical protein
MESRETEINCNCFAVAEVKKTIRLRRKPGYNFPNAFWSCQSFPVDVSKKASLEYRVRIIVRFLFSILGFDGFFCFGFGYPLFRVFKRGILPF